LETRTADAVMKHLNTLGLAQLAEWDVLAFIHHHGTNLASAGQIAALVGYTKIVVGSALESLTAKGLVQRSRHSHGVRFYQSADMPPGGPLRIALEGLVKVAEDRQGRLLLATYLRQAARDRDLRARGGLHLA